MHSLGSRVYFDFLCGQFATGPEASDLTFFALFSFRFPIVLDLESAFFNKNPDPNEFGLVLSFFFESKIPINKSDLKGLKAKLNPPGKQVQCVALVAAFSPPLVYYSASSPLVRGI